MSPSRPRDLFLILMLGILSTISPFAIDLYLPAFADIGRELGTDGSRMALTLSSYFVGLAFGQIFYGPLLDRFGRKPPLYFGLSLFVIASYACSRSTSIESLVAFRFIQACGGCAAQVASIAMVRDFFPVKSSAKVFSLLTLILSVSPMLAPTAGSFIVEFLGWRWVFLLLALIVAIVLAVVFFFLPEPHQPDASISLRPKPIFETFVRVLRVPQFYTYAVAGSFGFAGLFTYVAGSPGIFLEHYLVSKKIYGVIFACLSVGLIGASQVNIALMKKFSSATIFRTALFAQFLFSLVLLATGFWAAVPLPVFLVLLFLFLSSVGLTLPNASALALMPFSKNAGSASAMLGILQMGIGAVASTFVGLFGSGVLPVVATFAGGSLIAVVIFIFGRANLPAVEAEA